MSVDYALAGKILSLETIMVADSNQIKFLMDGLNIRALSRAYIGVVHYKAEVTKIYKGAVTSASIDLYSPQTMRFVDFNSKLTLIVWYMAQRTT